MSSVVDPTDLDQVEHAELTNDLRRELQVDQRQRDVASLMATEHGRRVVRRLCEENFYYRTHASNNGVESQRAEGRRQVILELRDLIESVCPERLIQMEQEALQSRQDREQGQ